MPIVVLAFCVVTAIKALAAANSNDIGEPITLVDGFPIVVTFINDQGPFRLLIDTGATGCALRRSIAVRVGLIPHRELLLTTMVEKKEFLPPAPVFGLVYAMCLRRKL